MDIEEAKKMVGTEFIYLYIDGDSILAYVKKFDPEIGLTCMTLETKTRRDGRKPDEAQLEKDDTWCVIAHNFKIDPGSLEEALENLEEIKSTNYFQVSNYSEGNTGDPSCAFI